ncbi:MAG: DUF4199 domain-containing protein [Bacteroidales bacterium]|nr:DUF4199 domain-containing protein [Bacteroidales bacterium]
MALLHRYQSTMHGNYRKFILIFGPVAAVALILSVLARLYFFDPIETPVSWTDNVVLAICLIAFTLVYRATLPEKKITFKEIFILTVGLSCVAAVLYALYLWHYGLHTDPDFPQRFLDSEMAKHKPGEQGYEAAVEQVKYMANPKYLAFMGGVYTVVTAFILGFFVALLFRTERSPRYQKK